MSGRYHKLRAALCRGRPLKKVETKDGEEQIFGNTIALSHQGSSTWCKYFFDVISTQFIKSFGLREKP
jgi:hypothetical protein